MHFPPRIPFRWLPLATAVLAGVPATRAQIVGDSVAVALAGLREDVRILDERTRALTVEIEQLKRENKALREQASSTSQFVSLAQFNTALAELEKALRAGDREVALQLTQQMERLAKQTQSALDTLAKSAATRTPSVTTQFAEDYPKQGVTYNVQPGDTLSSIAAKFNAQIRDIQNANKIADPKTLQAGQTLFIPQR